MRTGTITELVELLKRTVWADADQRFEAVCAVQEHDPHLVGPLRDEVLKVLAAGLGWTPDRTLRLLPINRAHELRRALNKHVNGPTPDVRLEDERIYPKTGWIGEYLRHTQGSEVPLAWHFWCAVATLGAALRRTLYVDRGNHFLWTNFYLLLIGPSGDGKGSAINAALDVLARLNVLLEGKKIAPDKRIKVLPDKPTPERIVGLLQSVDLTERDGSKFIHRHTDSVGVIVAKELAVMLGRTAFHADQAVVQLTDLWDCPEEWVASTVGTGDKKLYQVALTFIGASTPEWARNSVTDDVMAGGFLSRVILSFRPDSGRSYSTADSLDPIMANWLAEELVPLATNKLTEFRGDPSWDDWFEGWYENNRSLVPEDPRMRGYYRRRPAHLIKTAMVLAVSDGRRRGTSDDLRMALACLEAEERWQAEVLGQMTASKSALLADHTMNVLWKWGGSMSHSALFNRVSRRVGTSREFAEIIETLKSQKRLVAIRDETKRATHYKAVRWSPNEEDMV